MKTTISAFVVLLAIFVFCFLPYGQVATRQTDTTHGLSAPLVIAQTAADHIRFTALTTGSRMRHEIPSPAGNTLFDSDFRPGTT